MVTIMSEEYTRNNPNKAQTVKTFAGLSTDTKPTTNVENGSTFLEMDTGDLYVFDKTNTQWREL